LVSTFQSLTRSFSADVFQMLLILLCRCDTHFSRDYLDIWLGHIYGIYDWKHQENSKIGLENSRIFLLKKWEPCSLMALCHCSLQ